MTAPASVNPPNPQDTITVELSRLLEALEVAALGSYEERLLPEDTVSNPYEEKGLVTVGRDISDEFYCHWTPKGIDFVRETIESARTALAEGQGEQGKLPPKPGLLSSDGFVLTAGRLRFSYSDSDECTCCDGTHCYACGIDLDGHPLGAAGLSEMVTDFVYPLRHQGMEGRPVEVAIVLKQPSPDSKEETRG